MKFSLLSHTWLKDMKISLQSLWLFLWCFTQAIPVKQAMALTKRSEEAIRHWYDLFRLHLPESAQILKKVIQMDEAYGTNWSLLLAKQKKTRKLAWNVIPQKSVERQHAFQFLQTYVRPRSRLYTDGALIYKGIGKWWPIRHQRDFHNKWEFGKTSEIEGMFGNFRTFLRRMYHHVTPKKMPEYVSEFCLRFSLPELFENPSNYLSKTLSLVPID